MHLRSVDGAAARGHRLSCAWTLAAAVGAAAPQEDAEPAGRARAERLARERGELDARIGSLAADDQVEAFARALREFLDASGPPPYEGRWNEAKAGWVSLTEADRWLRWNRPSRDDGPPIAADFARRNHPFPGIVDLSEQLHRHGIEFLLAVFPSRLELHPELVLAPEIGSDEALVAAIGAGTTRFLRALNERGVETVDLLPAFAQSRGSLAPGAPGERGERGAIYFRFCEHHWTPRGAELAAEVVAGRIRAMPWYEAGPLREGTQFAIEPREAAFRATTRAAAQVFPSESLAFHGVRMLQDPVGLPPARRSPIVVLSDSFALFHGETEIGSSFVDHLSRHTGWTLDVIAPRGGAELTCRQTLARRHDRLGGKRVVVWLVSSGLLRAAAGFRKVDLFEE